MWNIPAQMVFQVINLSSHFVSVFTILNVRKLLTPNSLDAVTRFFFSIYAQRQTLVILTKFNRFMDTSTSN